MPKILPHSIEVFLESESLASSNGNSTTKENTFRSQLMNGRPPEPLPPNTKAEMNSNNATWKLLQKKVTDWMRKHQDIKTELGVVSIDESAECTIHDALTHEDRNEIVRKRVRKAFVG